MAKPRAKCHICNKPIKADSKDVCVKCGADLLHPENEIKYKEKSCQYLTNRLGVGWEGMLYMTDKRVFFYQTAPLLIGLGLIEYKSSKISFSLTPQNVHSSEKNVSVMFSSTLTIKDTDGNEYRISMSRKSVEEWYDAIERFRTFQIKL